MDKIIMTQCEHCFKKQVTLLPWKHTPICRFCNKPVIKPWTKESLSKAVKQ